MTNLPPTPELDKMAKVREDNHTEHIGAFLDDSKYELAEWVDCTDYHGWGVTCPMGSHLVQVSKSIDQILMEHFGIDWTKVEEERRALLKDLSHRTWVDVCYTRTTQQLPRRMKWPSHMPSQTQFAPCAALID